MNIRMGPILAMALLAALLAALGYSQFAAVGSIGDEHEEDEHEYEMEH